jgi:hypothetical protein
MGTVDRRPYESATALDQALLDESQDNLTNRLEMIADVEVPGATLRLSDRAKYVGSTFYYPRVEFPTINRTVGEWLSSELQFSSLELKINNTDKKYSNYLPGGADYDGFVGRRVTIKVGLAELASSYKTIFTGVVTDEGGFNRDTSTFTLICRNDFDRINTSIPDQVLIPDDWPDIEDQYVGLGAPVIYGDWTTEIRPEAPEIPAYPVNGGNAGVIAGTTDLRLVISSTPISVFDDTSVTLLRGDTYYTFNSSDISVVGGTDNQVFDITQQNLMIEGNPWIYSSGDQFFLKVKGVDLGAYDDNLISQARDILERFGGLGAGDFHSNWTTYRDKSSPAESNVAGFKSRVWLQESTGILEYALSMLEQVRLEAYINRDNVLQISSLQLDDFDASPGYTVKNWDVVRDSFKPMIDERNNFNRAKAEFAFNPAKGQQRLATPLYRNQAAINQNGKTFGKLIVMPNLYLLNDVVLNLKEILKLSSAYAEKINVSLTPRSVLKDVSNFALLDVKIGTSEYENAPVMFRSIGYDPRGLAIPAELWSFQMVPFPGWSPGYSGITGGSTATITQET